MIRNYGSQQKYQNDIIGLNSRLDPIQAAFLTEKLAVLDEWNARRAKIADAYIGGMSGMGLVLPGGEADADPSWHLFVVRHPERDLLASRLAAQGIDTLIHYPIPPHAQKAYAHLGLRDTDLPLCSTLAREVLSLPIGPHMTMGQVEQVIDGVRKALS